MELTKSMGRFHTCFILVLLGFVNVSLTKDGQGTIEEGSSNLTNGTLTSEYREDNENIEEQKHDGRTPTSFLDDFVPTTDCPLCDLEKHPIKQRLTPDQLKKMRIELIKRDILKKLRLEEAPKLTNPLHEIPAPLRTGKEFYKDEPPRSDYENDDRFYGKLKEVAIFGKKIPECIGSKPSTCISFDISTNTFAQQDFVESVGLWVYKLRDENDNNNQSITVSELAQFGKSKKLRTKRMVSYKITDIKQGWIRFDLKKTLTRWMKKPHINFGLKISCKTCRRPMEYGPIATKEEFQPFLDVKMRSNSRSRVKRRIKTCDSMVIPRCCREHFNVSFREIGWNWIHYPSYYIANYCKGSCENAVELYVNGRSHVIKNVRLTSQDRRLIQDIMPCCAPTRMSAINIFYENDSGTAIVARVPNMIVEECGCL